MQEVPKIVFERLKATAVADHPDADVLTAFSERALTEVDRAMVLEHLGLCADCREIVALALPVEEQVSTVMSPSPSRGWLAWPALRWAFVAAGLVIVSSVGIVQYRQHARSETALNAPPAHFVTTQTPKTVSPAPAVAEPARPATAGSEKHEVRTQVPAPEESAKVSVAAPSHLYPLAPAAHGTRSSGGVRGTISAFTAGQPGATGDGNQPAPVVETVEVASAVYPAVDMNAAWVDTETKVSRSKPGESLPDRSWQEVTYPAIPPVTTAAPGGVGFQAVVSVAPGSLPTWNISSSGALQRSFNDGRTWEDVDVSDADELAGRSTSGSLPIAKAKQVKHEKAVFRTVAANGPDIWAGGLDGQLYHSSDAGAHWSRVIPAFSGTVLTGDIIRVVFDDGMPDRILTSTSTPESWVSMDGGKTWQKQ
jgi:hypothetical protein